MKFSVIVPVYNIEKYVEKCIESIISQSFRDFELILIDDGSTDSSGLICDEYSKKDSRIIVVHKSNGGLVSAKKEASRLAKGDYVITIDGDDYILDGYFLNINNLLNKHNVDVLCCSYINDKHEPKKSTLKNGLYYASEILKTFFYDEEISFPNDGQVLYSMCMKIVKRDIYLKNQQNISNEITMGEDLLLSYKIFNDSNNVFVSDLIGYVYRTNPNSITKKLDFNRYYKYVLLCSFLQSECKDYPNKVYCYALNKLLETQSYIAKNVKTYLEFKKTLKELDYLSELNLFGKQAKVKKISFSWRIKKYLNKHSMYFAMYHLYRFRK